MIVFGFAFSIFIILIAGRLLLGLKPFNIGNEPFLIRFPLYFYAGTAVLSLYMFILSQLNIRLSIPVISVPFLIFLVYLLIKENTYISSIKSLRLPTIEIKFSLSMFLWLILGLLCASMLANSIVLPIFSKDAFSMWFFKTRIFFMEKRIPFEILTNPAYSYSSPEYPQLVPLNLAWISLCIGQFNDAVLRLFFAFGFALFIPLFYNMLKQYIDKVTALIAAFFLFTNVHVLEYAANGYVDLMLGIFAGIALMYLIKWMGSKDVHFLYISAVFIGSAAFIKNDGIGLFLAMSLALAVFLAVLMLNEKRDSLKLLMTFISYVFISSLIFMPYQMVSASHHISSHMIKNANIFATTIENLGRAPVIANHFIFELFLNTYSWQYFWIFITAIIIIGRKNITRAGNKYAGLFLILALSVYFMIYMLTATDNLTSSFHRLLIGLAPSAVFFSFSLLGEDR